MKQFPTSVFYITAAVLFPVATADAHHFKGLPHYNYFDNYPQIPEEEYVGQADPYAFSLVLYDFQGIQREDVQDSDKVRLFLVAFNLHDDIVYNGPATLEVLDREEVVHREQFEASAEESIYAMYRSLPASGKYSLRVTLHGHRDLQCVIPFQLSSQITHWGRWIGLALLILIVIAAIGARKARVRMDRRSEARQRLQREGQNASAAEGTDS